MLEKTKKLLFSATSLALIEKVAEMIINFLFSMFVVRTLEIEDYAVITTFTGYMTFVGFINIAPETYLFKTYSTLSSEYLNKKISAFIIFDIIKASIIFVVYAVIGAILSLKFANFFYFMIAITNALILMCEQFYCVGRIILEINAKQYKLTRLTSVSKTVRVLLILTLFVNNSFVIYCLIMFGVALIEDIIAYTMAVKEVDFKLQFDKKEFSENIKSALSEFVLLHHVVGVLNSIVYSSDTVFLGWFCDEKIVGHYGIVLSCINYVAVVYQVLQKQISIAFGRSAEIIENQKVVKRFLKLCAGISIMAMVGYLCIGDILLRIYAGNSYVKEMYWYALFILLGTSFFNIVRPMLIYIIYRGDLFKYLRGILVPVFIICMITYCVTSKVLGGIGLAFGNIIVYGIWSIMTCICYYRLVKIQREKYNNENIVK